MAGPSNDRVLVLLGNVSVRLFSPNCNVRELSAKLVLAVSAKHRVANVNAMFFIGLLCKKNECVVCFATSVY